MQSMTGVDSITPKSAGEVVIENLYFFYLFFKARLPFKHVSPVWVLSTLVM